MANADTPDDALTARNKGAQGIGLCRTEHMVMISLIMVMVIVIVQTIIIKENLGSLSVGFI